MYSSGHKKVNGSFLFPNKEVLWEIEDLQSRAVKIVKKKQL